MSMCTGVASRSLANRRGLRWSTLLFLVGSSGSPHFPSGFRSQCQQLPLGISTRGTPPGFSRATGHVGGGLQQPMGNQETRLVVRLVRTSHCCHPAREGRPPVFGHGCTSPLFFRRGDVGLLSAQARGPASGGSGLPRNRVQGGVEARAWSLRKKQEKQKHENEK